MDAQETRKLLELAAKAASMTINKCGPSSDGRRSWMADGSYWQPFDDDGDALRLACALSIDILHRVVGGERVEAIAPGVQPVIEHCTKETRAAATRLAVLRAAATVGERMNAAP